MPANIIIDQTTLSAGVANKSRNDGVLSQVVTCTNASAESSYVWTIVDTPIRSTVVRGTTSTSASLAFTPDVKGTYLIKLQVNNSILPVDTQMLYFSVASAGTFSLGWRYLAATESTEDNTEYAGLGFTSDINPRGWATVRDLQQEETEDAVARVQQAVDTAPLPGTDHLVKVDSATGFLDDTLLPQALLEDGTRPMSGDLAMGGNNITGVGTVDGVDVAALGTSALLDTDFAGTELGEMTRTGTGTYAVLKHNRSATTDPGISNDSTEGYASGSEWVNETANTVFKCTDAAAGAAVWVALGVASATTLQDAFDAGPGIDTSTAGVPVTISHTGTAGSHDLFTVTKTPSGATAGRGIAVSMGANSFSEGVDITHAGTGVALSVESTGTGDAVQVLAATNDEIFSVDSAGEPRITPGANQKMIVNLDTHNANDTFEIRLDNTDASFLDLHKVFSTYTGFGTTSGAELMRLFQVGGSADEVSVFMFAADPNGQVTKGDAGSLGFYNGSWYIKNADSPSSVWDQIATTGTPGSHAASHITGGSDEIDGDQVDIDWNPNNYTPTTAPTEATNVDHLTAHLAGIDGVLADVIVDGDFAGGSTPGDMIKTGTGAYAIRKHNLAATTNPDANDDNLGAWSVGSRWINTTDDRSWLCLDASTAAAVWYETTNTRLLTRNITAATANVGDADNYYQIRINCTTADCVLTVDQGKPGTSFVVTCEDSTYLASFAQGVGVTIQSDGDTPNAPAILGRYTSATVRYITDTIVQIDGNIASPVPVTMQNVYDAGPDVTQDATGGMEITKAATSAEAYVLKLTDANSTDDVFQVSKTATGAGDGIEVTMGASTTGRGMRLVRQGTGAAVLITDGGTNQLSINEDEITGTSDGLTVSILGGAVAGDIDIIAGTSTTVGNIGGDVTIAGGATAAASGATGAAKAGGVVETGATGGASDGTDAAGAGGDLSRTAGTGGIGVGSVAGAPGGSITDTAGTGGAGATSGGGGGAGGTMTKKAGTGGFGGATAGTPGVGGDHNIESGDGGLNFEAARAAAGDMNVDTGLGVTGLITLGKANATSLEIGSTTNNPDVQIYPSTAKGVGIEAIREGSASDYYAKQLTLEADQTGLTDIEVYTCERDPNGTITAAVGSIAIAEDGTYWQNTTGSTVWKALTDLTVGTEVTATTATLDDTNHGESKEYTGAGSTCTITVDQGRVGCWSVVYFNGATGKVVFAQGSGVTINSIGAVATAPEITDQYGRAMVEWISATEVYITGDIV